MLPLIILAAMMAMDIITTLLAIKAGAMEANPLYFGKPTLLKLLLLHAVSMGAALAARHHPLTVWIMAGIFAAVDVNNLIVLLT